MENSRTKKLTAREHLNTMRYFRDQQHIKQIDLQQRERFDMWVQQQAVKIGRDMRDENQLSGGFFSRRQNRSPGGRSGSGPRHQASRESSVEKNSPH